MPLELPAEIASTIPPEVLSHESLQSFNDVGSVFKSYIDTKSMVGRSIQLPGKDSKPEDVDRWATETGAKLKDHGYTIVKPSALPVAPPQSPDGYEFTVEGVAPEVVKADPVVNSFRTFAHSKGFNAEQANAAVNWYVKEVVPMLQKAGEGQVDMVEDEAAIGKILDERFKGETVTRRTEYDKGVLALSQTIPDLKDFLEGTAPYGKSWIPNKAHPAIIQLISEVGRMTNQDFGGNMNSNGQAVDQGALAEAHDIQSNPNNAKYQLYRNNDRATVDYVNSLYEKAHGKNEIDVNDFKPRVKVG